MFFLVYFDLFAIMRILLDNVNEARIMRKMRPIQRDDVVASYLTVSSNNPVNSTINNNKEEE